MFMINFVYFECEIWNVGHWVWNLKLYKKKSILYTNNDFKINYVWHFKWVTAGSDRYGQKTSEKGTSSSTMVCVNDIIVAEGQR